MEEEIVESKVVYVDEDGEDLPTTTITTIENKVQHEVIEKTIQNQDTINFKSNITIIISLTIMLLNVELPIIKLMRMQLCKK